MEYPVPTVGFIVLVTVAWVAARKRRVRRGKNPDQMPTFGEPFRDRKQKEEQ